MNNIRKFPLYVAFFVAAIAHHGSTYGMAEQEQRLNRENELLRENRELRNKITELEKNQDKRRLEKEEVEAEFLKCMSKNSNELKKDTIPYSCRALASQLAACAGRSAVENAHGTALYITNTRS